MRKIILYIISIIIFIMVGAAGDELLPQPKPWETRPGPGQPLGL